MLRLELRSDEKSTGHDFTELESVTANENYACLSPCTEIVTSFSCEEFAPFLVGTYERLESVSEY